MSDWQSNVTILGFDIGVEKFMYQDLVFAPNYLNQALLKSVRPIWRPFCKVTWDEIIYPSRDRGMGAFSLIEAREGITAMFWSFLGGCVVGAVSAWVVMG